MAGFANVEFSGKEIATVPLTWLNEERTVCYWPCRVTSAAIAAKKSMPVDSTFKAYDIRVLKLYETYETARKDLVRLEVESSGAEGVSVHASTSSRKRIPSRKRSEDLVYSDESEEERPPKRTALSVLGMPPSPPSRFVGEECHEVIGQQDRDRTEREVRERGDGDRAQRDAERPERPVQQPQSTSARNDSFDRRHGYAMSRTGEFVTAGGFEGWTARKLMMMDNKLSALIRGLLPSPVGDNMMRSLGLPMSSRKKLKKANKKLASDQDYAENMRAVVRMLGGDTVSKVVAKVMTSIMTDDVMMEYNMDGRTRGGDTIQKKSFRKLERILTLIKEAVRSNRGVVATDTQIETAIARFLKYSKQRSGRATKKTAVEGAEQVEE